MPVDVILITTLHAVSLQHTFQISQTANQVVVAKASYACLFRRKSVQLMFSQNSPLSDFLIVWSICQYHENNRMVNLFSAKAESLPNCTFDELKTPYNGTSLIYM